MGRAATERATSDRALFDHFRVIGRYRKWIGAVVVLVAIAGYLSENAKAAQYQAATAVRFVVPEVATSGSTARDSALLLSASFQRSAGTTAFADRVRVRAGGNLTTTSVQQRVKVVAAADVPGFLDVSATGTTARGAADLADATAAELADFIRSEQDRIVSAALAPLKQQLTDVDTGLAAAGIAESERAALIDQRGQITRLIAEQEQRLRPAVLVPEPAPLPLSPTGPNPARSAITYALLALVLATEGIVVFRFLRGRLPLGDPAAEIGRLVDAPVLELGPSGKRRPSQALLPFVLEHLAGESVITVVQRDGAPTTLPGSMIADALSRSGARVLLVDADTRTPMLHHELDVPLSPGLAEVVSGAERLSDAVRPSPTGSGVVVLSAGTAVEPSARTSVANGGLEALVHHTGADVNVVVTSSSTALDDALLVVHQFPSAVVLAVDARSARRSEIVETARVIRSIGGNVVGALCVHTASPGWREGIERLRRIAA